MGNIAKIKLNLGSLVKSHWDKAVLGTIVLLSIIKVGHEISDYNKMVDKFYNTYKYNSLSYAKTMAGINLRMDYPSKFKKIWDLGTYNAFEDFVEGKLDKELVQRKVYDIHK